MKIKLDTEKGRSALIVALRDAGFDVFDEDAGAGFHVISVPILKDNGVEALSITASCIGRPCEIGLDGYRTYRELEVKCGSAEFLAPATLDQAVDAFKTHWAMRCGLINDLRAGNYDLQF